MIVSNDPEIHELRTELERDNFEISHFAPISKYLGTQIEYNRTKNTLKITQREYIEAMLHKYGMTNCKPVSTPMCESDKPSKHDKPTEGQFNIGVKIRS